LMKTWERDVTALQVLAYADQISATSTIALANACFAS